MIDNDFVYHTCIDLDLDYLKKMVSVQKHIVTGGLAGHQRYVNTDEYLSSIRNKLPFLSPIFNIYSTRPRVGIVLHTDAKRKCAFNIPIANTNSSTTSFYEYAEEPVLTYNEKNVYYEIKSKVNEMFNFSLTQPALINNSSPHAVKNWGDEDRVIISWSMDENITFSEAKEFFKKAGY